MCNHVVKVYKRLQEYSEPSPSKFIETDIDTDISVCVCIHICMLFHIYQENI